MNVGKIRPSETFADYSSLEVRSSKPPPTHTHTHTVSDGERAWGRRALTMTPG